MSKSKNKLNEEDLLNDIDQVLNYANSLSSLDIENADLDKLQHKIYTKEFRTQMVLKRTSVLKMTQKQLANKLNLPEKCIKDIESGVAIYNPVHSNKIKRLLKI